jgi:hypothetical protein
MIMGPSHKDVRLILGGVPQGAGRGVGSTIKVTASNSHRHKRD